MKRVELAKWLLFLSLALMLGGVVYELWPERARAMTLSGYDGLQGTIHRTPGLAVQFWYEGRLFATRDKVVYRSEDNGVSWSEVAMLEAPKGNLATRARQWLSGLKLGRLIRQPCGVNLRLLQNGTVLAVSDGVFRGRLVEGEVVRLRKTHSGPRSLAQGWTEDMQGVVYFGEYQLGTAHSATRLYWSRDGGESWDIRYEFPRSEIEHIHSVTYDPFRGLLWLTTGDRDHESSIRYSSDQGKTFQSLGSQGQDWRAVSIQSTPEAIYWGTDYPTGMNYLFRWNWATGRRDTLLAARNPFYYSAKDRSNLFFATAAELPKYGGTPHSQVWRIRDGDAPQLVLSWERGALERYLSGMVMFAQGTPPPGWLAFTPINLKGHHCEALVLKLKD